MDFTKTYNELKYIPDLVYEGYIWMSYKEYPKVLLDKKFDFNGIEQNPFIQEALLYNKEQQISVIVRHSGQYQITEFNLEKILNNSTVICEEKEYFLHRWNGMKKVKITQVWIPEKDENCAGMEVLQLKAHIFTGFVRKI